MLFMIDTCQANTMYSQFYSPNILATGSSELDQSSYSHHADNDVGVAVIDRYTYYNLEYLETQVTSASSKHTLADLFNSYDSNKIASTPGVRTDLFKRDLKDVLITDFFGNVQNVEVDGDGMKLDEDLLALARGIGANVTESQWKEAMSSAKGHLLEQKVAKPIKSRSKGNAVKVSEEDGDWIRKAVGGGALAVCLLVWIIGSIL